MKRTVFTVLLLLCISAFTGCGEKPDHKHAWIPQTCTEPVTCTICGATKGEPWNHRWTKATCLLPKTCSLCGLTEGEPLEHTWKEATLETPKSCVVCGFETDEYQMASLDVLGTYKELIAASENCIIFADEKGYGVIDTEGNVLVKSKYTDALTSLQGNAFALAKCDEETYYYDLYDKDANLIWSTPKKYSSFKLVGYAGDYLTLHDEKENIWVYLDAKNNFESKAYIDANIYGKEKLSLAMDGYVSTQNVASLGYPYINLEGPEYISGQFEDEYYFDARGCAPSLDGKMSVYMYKSDSMGAFSLDSAGFYNVKTNEYTKVNDWYSDEYNLEHIVYYSDAGISLFDSFGDYMLLQSGEKNSVPVYDLYSIKDGKFLTDIGMKEIYLHENINIAGTLEAGGKVKYSYLDSQCNLIGNKWDMVTFFPDGFSMVLENGNAYIMNKDLALISEKIKAKSVYHKFGGYFIFEDDNGFNLAKIK